MTCRCAHNACPAAHSVTGRECDTTEGVGTYLVPFSDALVNLCPACKAFAFTPGVTGYVVRDEEVNS